MLTNSQCVLRTICGAQAHELKYPSITMTLVQKNDE